MRTYAPAYYKKFKCKAEGCKNNCCIGWEIDIDEKSLDFYKTKEDIKDKIDLYPTPHFALDKNERCPFLSQNNLCRIITKYGEEKLCQICSDHPRFKNYFETREEMGIGLTCEEGAKLILDNDFSLLILNDNDFSVAENSEEESFFKTRSLIFSGSFDNFKEYVPNLSLKETGTFLYSLERLDKKWENFINLLINSNKRFSEINITDKQKAKRLLDYFVFRYFHTASLSFCLLCTYIIMSVATDVYETARTFSSEIEYSEENLDRLFDLLC